MADNGFSIKIGVVGDAAKGLQSINKQLAGLRATNEKGLGSFQQLSKEFSKISDVTGWTKLSGTLKGVQGDFIGLAKSISPVAAGISALTSITSVAGLAKLAQSSAKFGTSIYNQSRQLSTSTQNLQKYLDLAKVAGIPVENMTSAIASFNDTTQAAVSGRNRSAALDFHLLGIDPGKTFNGKTFQQAGLQTLDAIAGSGKSIQVQEQMAAQLGLADLIPLLVQGKSKIDYYLKEANEIPKLTDKQIAADKKLSDTQDMLGAQFDATAQIVGQQFVPYLQMAEDTLTSIVTYAGQHPKWAAEWIEGLTATGILITGLWGTAKVAEIAGGVATFAKGISALTKVMFGLRDATVAAAGAQVALDVAEDAGGGGKKGLLKTAAKLLAGGATDAAIVGGGGAALSIGAGALLAGGLGYEGYEAYQSSQQPYQLSHGAARNRSMFTGGSKPSSGQSALIAKAVKYFESQGWSPAQAAGIVSNLYDESRLNPSATGDFGGAHGLAQWHDDRIEAIKKATGINVETAGFDDQLRAVNWELNHTESAAGRTLKQETTAQGAAGDVSKHYERPFGGQIVANSRALGLNSDVNPDMVSAIATQAAQTALALHNGTLDIKVTAPAGMQVTAVAKGNAPKAKIKQGLPLK